MIYGLKKLKQINNNMKILLINPPQVFSKSQVAASVIPPLGLMYLASVSQEKGYEVKIIDALVEAPDKINGFDENTGYRGLNFDDIVRLVPKDTDIIGISNLFTFAYPIVKELSKKIKEKFDTPIVVGGAHPLALPEEVLKSSKIDYVIIGEGEQPFLDLCEFIRDKRVIEDVSSLAFRKGNKIKRNPRKSYIEDLDKLPFPDRDLISLEKYYKVHEAHGPSQDRWTPIISSRGCPFECTFCTSVLWDRRWRPRSAKNVVDEIEACVKKYRITEFHFEDENLTFNKKRMIEICDEIIKRKLKIKWQTPNGIRASVTDKETLKKMRKAGCYHITVAPESGSERVLNEIIRKHQNLEQVKNVVSWGKRYGMKVAAYFVIGLPGEKKEELIMSSNYANKLAKMGLDEVVFSLFIPLPGSELYSKLKQENRLPKNLTSLISIGDLSKSISWSEFITNEELGRLRKSAYLKFHLTRLIYHPGPSFKTFFNIIRGHEELKSERAMITFIKRFTNR